MRALTFAVVVCTSFALGCESKPYGLAPVSGVIKLDGKPVPGAQVSFQPQGTTATPGPGSAGLCDSTGRYELQTIRKEPGAVPGPHAVRIYGPRGTTNAGSDSDVPGRKELFPNKYNFQTTLTFTVPEDGSTEANFDLSSK